MKEEQKLFEDTIKRYKFNLDLALKNCQFLYSIAENVGLTNEDYFINWTKELKKLADVEYRKL